MGRDVARPGLSCRLSTPADGAPCLGSPRDLPLSTPRVLGPHLQHHDAHECPRPPAVSSHQKFSRHSRGAQKARHSQDETEQAARGVHEDCTSLPLVVLGRNARVHHTQGRSRHFPGRRPQPSKTQIPHIVGSRVEWKTPQGSPAHCLLLTGTDQPCCKAGAFDGPGAWCPWHRMNSDVICGVLLQV